MVNKWLLLTIASIAAREVFQLAVEHNERRQVFRQARDYADSVGKPLLVIGAPKWRLNHPCGDVTIDISPEMAKFCNGQVADIRDIPYPDGYFGAAFASHVLEHLPTIEDAKIAFDEMERVADRVFIVSPHKTTIVAWLHPQHHLWVTPTGDGYIIEQRGRPDLPREESYLPREESYLISMEVV
ncbi:MAG: class I SAM-dependent methyltransferase [Dehalococcoidia bacterium]